MNNKDSLIHPLLKLAFDAMEDLVYIMAVQNRQFVYCYVNQKAELSSGITSEYMGKNFFELYSERDQYEMAQYLHNKYSKVLIQAKSVRFDEGHLLPTGTLSGDSIISPIFDEQQNITHLLCITRSYEERHHYQEKMQYYAYHDELTQLLNRRFLYEFVTQPAYLFMFDIDNLKYVNDTLGMESGDALLVEVAGRLKRNFSSDYISIRLSGDEFILVSNREQEQPEQMAEIIISLMNEPFLFNNRQIKINVSVGTAFFSEDINISIALRRADIALYHAKTSGRNKHHLFCETTQYEQVVRFNYELALNSCLEKEELQLLYQPIYGNKQKQVVAVEALLRWKKDHKYMVSPADFIPVAEETGLIIPIGEWVIRQACRDLTMIQAKYGQQTKIAINISRIQLSEPDFIDRINQILKEEHVNPHDLDLEITESVAMIDTVSEHSSLLKLREQGYTISIDDFGTGYSSLSTLTRLPIDNIKIDRSFVAQMNPPVLKALIAMAEALELHVVAEGIEEEQQWRQLLELGCNDFQGYWISYPMPLASLPDLPHFLSSFSSDYL